MHAISRARLARNEVDSTSAHGWIRSGCGVCVRVCVLECVTVPHGFRSVTVDFGSGKISEIVDAARTDDSRGVLSGPASRVHRRREARCIPSGAGLGTVGTMSKNKLTVNKPNQLLQLLLCSNGRESVVLVTAAYSTLI